MPSSPEWWARENRGPTWNSRDDPKLPAEKKSTVFTASLEDLNKIDTPVGSPEYQKKVEKALDEVASSLKAGQMVGWSVDKGYYAVDVGSIGYYK